MIIATRNNIFVRPIVENSSRLILPPIFKKKTDTVQKGTIIACGPKSHFQAGDTIIFDKWEDNEITVEGEKLLLIKPNAIVVVE